MKTILIPVDFSQESEKALSVAATIAKRIPAKLVLTHMMEIDNNTFSQVATDGVTKALYNSKLAAKRFDEFQDNDYLEDIIIEPLIQNHINFNNISSLADDISADLIIMGSSGSSGISEIIVGSNTEKVVRSANVPVLVVKKNGLHFSSDTILFVSDFNQESISAYHRIMNLAQILRAQVSYLYINLPGKAFKSTKQMDEILFNFFTKANHKDPIAAIKMVNRYADFSVEEGIYNFASLSATDIIAIPTHGRKGLAHLINGSLSEDIANHSIIPVLTVKI